MSGFSREPPSQDVVLEALRRGGAQALAVQFTQHRARLEKMVELRLDRRVAQRVDASDILQDAFIESARRLPDYLANPEAPLFIWLRFIVGQRVAIAHRRHLGTVRRSAVRESHMPVEEAIAAERCELRLASALASPSSAAIRSESEVQLRRAIEVLGARDREILLLRHFELLSNAEAAAELHITAEAASKRYCRALERLREQLQDNS